MSYKKFLFVIITVILVFVLYLGQREGTSSDSQNVRMLTLTPSQSRNVIQEKLKNEQFDLLIIGGGATGAGAALDAANRGFKVALIERFDFASGTSSKSTKLLHGGVRYLEKAVFNFDKQQYDLVIEGLTERENLFQIAPHLAKPIEIITPIYSWWEVPYYWVGLKVYDWIAGSTRMPGSGYFLPSTLVEKVPQIRTEGLTGGVVYYDGQFNDTRLNITLIQSALALDATALNYVEVTDLIFDENKSQIIGATVHDKISDDHFEIKAKVVINATGPYVDAIRKMDDPKAVPVIMASSGTHIVLDKSLMPGNAGLLVPKTKDGRVIFMLPWEGNVLVGTTDNPAVLSDHPEPTEEDLLYLLSYVEEYLDVSLEPSAVKSVWTGLRPLVKSPNAKDTASLVRDHFIEQTPSGLISITGGKWTTFRRMAEDVVNTAAKQLGKEDGVASTTQLRLIGSKGYYSGLSNALKDQFGISQESAEHLVSSYGSIAYNVLERGNAKLLNTQLTEEHPMLWSEVLWALEEEMAQKPMDILVRRTRLGTLDADAAKRVLPKIAAMMQAHLEWDSARTAKEVEEAMAELNGMTP